MTHSEFSHSEFQRHQTERDIPKKLNFLSSLLKCLNLIKITNEKNKSRDSFFEEKPFRVVCASECREKIISDAESFCQVA